MNNYVVCINSMINNEMEIIKVVADDKKEAIIKALNTSKNNYENYNILSAEDIIEYYFDADILVSEPLQVKEF